VQVAGRTHIGLVRKRNEDSMYLGTNLLAVADGMGGHVSGDVASTTVIEAIRPFDQVADPDRLGVSLSRAVGAANDAMRRRIVADPILAGMGTTLVAVMWSGSSFVIANVGDSRAYLLRAGKLIQLTDDHVYGRLLANAGNVPHLPERLSRFLDGRSDGRSPDLAPLNLRDGDRVLLCSDGLSSFVPRAQIHDALASTPGPDEASDQLVALALERGGPDNVTVIVADVAGRE
jgi:serine/threonine protein phosphatase PrpC